MPTGKMKNLCYRAALPLLAPTAKGHMTHMTQGRSLTDIARYERLLARHHVLGASLLLADKETSATVYTSVMGKLGRTSSPGTMFRVASITKIATAVVTLMLVDEGRFTLDTPISALLPDADDPALFGITVRQLLCHTSGLRDIPAVDRALANGATFHEVLADARVRASVPGVTFSYCNFGFGLLGCMLEHLTGQTLDALFQERLFAPLGMRATLDASTLDEGQIMPITRVLRYREGQDVTITALGRRPMTAPDPERRFGHTAGAMYTDAASLSRLLRMIAGRGELDGVRYLSPAMAKEMTVVQARYGKISPTLSYGLGLFLIEDRSISVHRVIGHQGYAYGCADGAFYEEGTGRQVIFLNGGCSEARVGRLGLCNRDVLRWALKKEVPTWK